MNYITSSQAAAILKVAPGYAVRLLDAEGIKPACWIGAARAYEPSTVKKLAARRMIRKFKRRKMRYVSWQER